MYEWNLYKDKEGFLYCKEILDVFVGFVFYSELLEVRQFIKKRGLFFIVWQLGGLRLRCWLQFFVVDEMVREVGEGRGKEVEFVQNKLYIEISQFCDSNIDVFMRVVILLLFRALFFCVVVFVNFLVLEF